MLRSTLSLILFFFCFTAKWAAGDAAAPPEGPDGTPDRPGAFSERPGEATPIRASRLFADHEVTVLLGSAAGAGQTVHVRAEGGDLGRLAEHGRGALPADCRGDGPLGATLLAGRVTSPARDDLLCLGEREIAPGVRELVLVMLGQPLRYAVPGRSRGPFRHAAVAVADVDPALDAEGRPHEEVIVAFRLAANVDIRVMVLNSSFERVLRRDISTPGFSNDGVLVLASGDLDGDGSPELVLARGRDAIAGTVGQRELTLEVLRFDRAPDGGLEMSRAGDFRFAIGAGIHGADLATGDFDGNGDDEIALAYADLRQGREVVDIFDAGPELQLRRALTGQIGPVFENALQTFVPLQVEAALLRLEPERGYLPWRRQVVVAGLPLKSRDDRGAILATAFDVGADLSEMTRMFQAGPGFCFPPTGPAPAPGLVVGNFRGLANRELGNWQVGFLLNDACRSGRRRFVPQLEVWTVNNAGRVRVGARLNFTRDRGEVGVQLGHVVAHDPAGRSLRFGPPARLTVEDFIALTYAIGEPPKHVDYLPVDPARPGGPRSVISVSATPDFYVRLTDSEQTQVTTVHESTTSASVGASSSESLRGSISAGVFGLESALSHGVEDTVTFEYRENRSELEESFTEFRRTETRTTSRDDALSYDGRLIDVWRFPLHGAEVSDAARPHAYFEIAVPGPLVRNLISGRDADWYQPRHSNNNALSYTPFSGSRRPGGFPADLGEFRLEGEAEPIRMPLNDLTRINWGGSATTLDIVWTEAAGEARRKEFANRFSLDREVSTAASAKVSFGQHASAGVEFETTYKSTRESNLARSELATVTLQQSRGITLRIPAADAGSQSGYGFGTAAYIAESGAFKVAHAADLLASDSGSRWWRSHYGDRPDPGLNLPNRFRFAGGEWHLADEPSYSQLRGVFLRDPRDGSLLSRGLIDGDRVRLGVRVYNFSLGPEVRGVPVSFRYQEVDANLRPLAEPREIGRATVSRLGPREMREATLVWNTRGLGGRGASPRHYVLRVEVDPDDVVRGEIHEGRDGRGEPLPGSNNHGYFPWSSSIAVFGRAARPVLSAANDMTIATDGLVLEAADGRLLAGGAGVAAGARYRLRATVRSELTDVRYRHVIFRQRGPGGGGGRDERILAHRVVHGLASGANTVSAWWEPAERGEVELSVELLEDSRDVRPGNARDVLAVRVVAARDDP